MLCVPQTTGVYFMANLLDLQFTGYVFSINVIKVPSTCIIEINQFQKKAKQKDTMYRLRRKIPNTACHTETMATCNMLAIIDQNN